MTQSPYPLASLTLVLGAPADDTGLFDEFQTRAADGSPVGNHAWAEHEHAALDVLTQRDGTLATHTLIETMLGGVLQVDVIVSDVDRQWVRHADGNLYVALTLTSEDVRPRAAARTLHDPALVEALNAVAASLAPLDGRRWMDWSARHWHDDAAPEQTTRVVQLVQAIAEQVLESRPPSVASGGPDDVVDLSSDLRHAIRQGRACACNPTSALSRELRGLRHLDPLRHEWDRVLMDASYLGALDATTLKERIPERADEALPWLYVGKERTDRLKADPFITPRFHRELLARAFMTAYALDRLAPRSSALLASAAGI